MAQRFHKGSLCFFKHRFHRFHRFSFATVIFISRSGTKISQRYAMNFLNTDCTDFTDFHFDFVIFISRSGTKISQRDAMIFLHKLH